MARHPLTIVALLRFGVSLMHSQPVWSQPCTFNLGGVWQLSNSNGSIHANASVPGMVHTDLLTAGLISEPYIQFNDRDLAWIVADDWTFSREFTPPSQLMSSTHATLTFEGLATIATVFLNGERLFSANNQFITWRIPVGGLLLPGANVLTVAFNSSTAFASAADHAYNMSTHNITSCVCGDAFVHRGVTISYRFILLHQMPRPGRARILLSQLRAPGRRGP